MDPPSASRFRQIALIFSLLSSFAGAAAWSATATVTVDAAAAGVMLQPHAYGANIAAWDAHLVDASTATLIHDAQLTILRYPGGSTADEYHWQTHTMDNGGYLNPADTF